jgi:NAD(P)-dependent dehydrogenase (short-subunit alcohol dehydrogenase family)
VSANSVGEAIHLTGQVAIVTGGGRGIGRAMVLALAKAEASVAAVARSSDQVAETVALVEGAGGRALAVTADVTDRRSVQQMAREVEQQLGPVDLLINNAGTHSPGGPLWENDPDDWWRCIDVNVRGPFLCCQVILPGMVTRRRGRIITTVSGFGVRPWPYASAYSVSKCAAVRLSENIAAEAREYGISAFSIDPGFVRTAMTEAVAESPEDERWFGGMFRKSLSGGHHVSPEHAARLAVFLASGRADALSGCYISVRDDVAEMVRDAEQIRLNQMQVLRLCSWRDASNPNA